MSCVSCVTYKTGFILDLFTPYTFIQLGITGNYSAITILHNLRLHMQ
jgi:hypothetical protein